MRRAILGKGAVISLPLFHCCRPVEQWVEKEKRILKPGDAAHIPAGVVHATFNVSKSDATILAILSPGASQGPFMVDVSGESPWKDLRAGA